MSVSGIVNYVQQGFGNHELSNLHSKTCVIALAVFTGMAVTAATVSIGVLFPLTTVAWAVPLTAVLGAIILWRLYSAFSAMHTIKPSFGDQFNSRIQNDQASCQLTKHAFHSHQVRCAMLKSAQHSIVYASSYAGSDALDEMLAIMEERLHTGVHIDLSIHTVNLTTKNKKTLKSLTKTFPKLFHYITFGEFTSYQASLFKSSIPKLYHAKGLSIDGGRMLILGGSSSGGSKNPDKPLLFLDDGQTEAKKINILGFGSFHDTDIVYYGDGLEPTKVGSLADKQLCDLHRLMRQRIHLSFYERPGKKSHKTPLDHLYKALNKNLNLNIDTKDAREKKPLNVELYVTAPEQNNNYFYDALIRNIKAENKEIRISHLYFHPDKKLAKALIDAANRNVKITVLHNSAGKKSPLAHRLVYVQRSQKALHDLIQKIQPEKRKNVQVYEFIKPHTTMHKKLIVFNGQNKVIVGTSNFSRKSLYAKDCDYEINLIITDPSLRAQALKQMEADQAQSELISNESKLKLKTRIMALFQALLPGR